MPLDRSRRAIPPLRATRLNLFLLFALGLFQLAAVPASYARHHGNPEPQSAHAARLTSDVAGSLPAREGDHIHVSADLGNIVLHTADTAGKAGYRLHLEANASDKNAADLLKSVSVEAHAVPDGVAVKVQLPANHSTSRLLVSLELDIPRSVSLDLSSGGGNIEADEIDGRVMLQTRGGNITVANMGGATRLETGGGNITAKNIAGELDAETGGGHITVGSIAGNAVLRTEGGHIRAGSIQGTARLDTGGGNITLERSGGDLTAKTGGGEIDVGEAAGFVRAKTGGGGIHVVRLVGPTDLQTAGGSIYLTQVDSPVRATTEDGGITAWFIAPAKVAGPTELNCDEGDIVVHLSKQMPVTIDARVQMGGDHRVIVDPALPLKVSYDEPGKGSRAVRAEGDLNGGGELLRLRTVAGNIQLVLTDVDKQLQLYKEQMDKLKQRVAPEGAETPNATH